MTVGRVDIGLLNRLIVDDVYTSDQEGKPLIKSDRLSVKIDISAILQGKMTIANIQIFGLTAYLRKSTPKSKSNYQFLIDAFSSDNNKHKSNINLSINSFILRRGYITYDVESEKSKPTFDINHLRLKNVDATLSLKSFGKDSTELIVKRFNFNETNSGLLLKNLQAKAIDKNNTLSATDITVKTHQSSVNIDQLTVNYANFGKDKTFTYHAKISDSFVTLDDFKAFTPALEGITTPLYFETGIDGSESRVRVGQTIIHSDDNSLRLSFDGYAENIQSPEKDFNANIQQMLLNDDGKFLVFKLFNSHTSLPEEVENLGTIDYSGYIRKTGHDINARGDLSTDAGKVIMNVSVTKDNHVSGSILSDSINIGKISGNNDFGLSAFDLNIDCRLSGTEVLNGYAKGNISKFEYRGHTYNDISIDATHNSGILKGTLNINDELAAIRIEGMYNQRNSHTSANADIESINPHALGLTDKLEGETYSLKAHANITGNNLNTITGELGLNSLRITTEDNEYVLDSANISISNNNKDKLIVLHTDFANARLEGDIYLNSIIDAFKNQVALHLPALIHDRKANKNHFKFDITVSESDILRHFIQADYTLVAPLHANGYIDDRTDTMYTDINAPYIITGSNKVYRNSHINLTSSRHYLSASLFTLKKGDNGYTQYIITADADADSLQTLVSWKGKKDNASNGQIYATTEFGDSLGTMKADISIHRSQLTMNDTLWQIEPSEISVYGKHILCKRVRVHNEEQSLMIDGTISESPNDSLVADLENVDIAYITDLVDFHAVRFSGLVSGQAVISNIYNNIHLNANVLVNDMHLQEGKLGTGYIQAFWDNDIKGMRVYGHIVDDLESVNRTTDVSGFIAPSTNDMDLKIKLNNTYAGFLNGFLNSTFKDINGNTNGELHVIGPLNDVNIVGDVSADVDMCLKATDVTYHINPADTLHFRPYVFRFDSVRISDKRGHEGIVNGTLSHKNMKNFKYDFEIGMTNLTIYDEREFNSDKFYATVFANADMSIHGSDGHPLIMSADVTPTKGSVFAYDAATPDAISTGSFVEFRDITPKQKEDNKKYMMFTEDNPLFDDEEQTDSTEEDYEYEGDIFMDISLHITPDCEIKLRMDNTDDGYITTFGNGNLLAHYHNKSPFSLNGVYQIIGGLYRLYLQDIIYRDLDLQEGSNVVFNGNPFDANIHLICHHTINSVPLRDLTSNTGYNQDSKVKVICELDITGKLGNMNFGFDILLPNVNDETRQLVRSLISTDDEMNMQMIYLLGLGRFYTNEYARANGEYGSNQVNTLISSTISGQINQMLSNFIGQDSKWNFGTGLSTGERGWNDLDVEGILSGRLLNDRLLINGNFGYRDNAMTNTSTFIGDFDVRWRLSENGNTFIKAYNQTNDRYFTKATLNTQGIGIVFQRDFDSWKALFRRKMKENAARL